MTENKLCPVCDTIVKGRSDKKYCSTKCRSIHQYENRQETERFYLKVEKQLRINRKVLKKYNRSGFTTIRKTELFDQGFDPNFFTHYWKNKKSDVYLFVYEYGFLRTFNNGKEKYLLIQWQDYMNKS